MGAYAPPRPGDRGAAPGAPAPPSEAMRAAGTGLPRTAGIPSLARSQARSATPSFRLRPSRSAGRWSSQAGLQRVQYPLAGEPRAIGLVRALLGGHEFLGHGFLEHLWW